MATPIPANRVCFSLAEVLEITGGVLASDAATGEVTSVTTDSRHAASGALFVALSGERHDGHDFVARAAAAGARAVLVERPVSLPVAGASPGGSSCAVITVSDTLRALGALARAHRERFSIPVVGITGSVGKTTTKELAAQALEAAGLRVLRTAGNLNNLIGVPMTLFGLEPGHDAAVIEMGMNVPGEIARLTEITRPTVGVVTSVAEVHTEGVGGIAGVAREKAALLVGLAPDATAIMTADDAALQPWRSRIEAARVVTFGLSESAQVRLIGTTLTATGTRADLHLADAAAATTGEGGALSVQLALIGEGPARSATAALAIALDVLGPSGLMAAVEGLGRVQPDEGRARPLAGPHGCTLLDDTYNASPRSTRLAMHAARTLAQARGGRAIAVLGDMLELGAESERLHEDLGAAAVGAGIEVLLACGSEMRAAARGALVAAARSAVRGVRIESLEDPTEAIDLLRDLVADGDVVLIKGSRSMRMERVVEALRADLGTEAS